MPEDGGNLQAKVLFHLRYIPVQSGQAGCDHTQPCDNMQPMETRNHINVGSGYMAREIHIHFNQPYPTPKLTGKKGNPQGHRTPQGKLCLFKLQAFGRNPCPMHRGAANNDQYGRYHKDLGQTEGNPLPFVHQAGPTSTETACTAHKQHKRTSYKQPHNELMWSNVYKRFLLHSDHHTTPIYQSSIPGELQADKQTTQTSPAFHGCFHRNGPAGWPVPAA